MGAYGLRLGGLDGHRHLLTGVEAGAPQFELEHELGEATAREETVDEREAVLLLRGGGEVRLRRVEGRIVFRTPRALAPDDLVHPYLAPAAAVAAYWHGWDGFHAGAVSAGGGALALLGDREGGKSSTLGWLAARGADVVCDDLLVLDGFHALPGPRCLDLRPDAARRLGTGRRAGALEDRERRRVTLGPLAERVELRGCVHLVWGDRLELRPVRGAERLARLVRHRASGLPPRRSDALVRLATLPAWELRRPAEWSSVGPAGEAILGLVEGAGG